MAKTERVRRHSLAVRLTHWVNVVAVAALLMSGLQIFNAHPALYWGQASTFAAPWVSVRKVEVADQPRGVTTIGDLSFDTTGVLGWSGAEGRREQRAFPAWSTIPSWRDLAAGRRWHFFFAWVFVANLAAYWLWSLARGHFRRDLLPTWRQLAPGHLLREVADHARLRFPRGEAARSYNAIQKLTYLAVVAGLLPLMVATGLSMSPGFNAALPGLIDLFGGRQSARTIHFLSAAGIVAFVLVHVALVVLSGPWNHLRAMVTGGYALAPEGDRP